MGVVADSVLARDQQQQRQEKAFKLTFIKRVEDFMMHLGHLNSLVSNATPSTMQASLGGLK